MCGQGRVWIGHLVLMEEGVDWGCSPHGGECGQGRMWIGDLILMEEGVD